MNKKLWLAVMLIPALNASEQPKLESADKKTAYIVRTDELNIIHKRNSETYNKLRARVLGDMKKDISEQAKKELVLRWPL